MDLKTGGGFNVVVSDWSDHLNVTLTYRIKARSQGGGSSLPDLPKQTERLSGDWFAAAESEEDSAHLAAMGGEVVSRGPAAAAVLNTGTGWCC